MANNVPNANLITSIKASGVERALFDACTGRLWNAKTAVEGAGKDAFKEFATAVAAARKALDEAEALHREWQACGRQRQGKRHAQGKTVGQK